MSTFSLSRLPKVVAVLLVLLCPVSAAAADPVLVAHANSDLDSISLNTIRMIFSMQLQRWPDGSAVQVFVLPDDSPVHRAFSKDLLRLYPRQLRRVWDRQLYSGTGHAPQTVANEAEMRRRIAATPGAIGYLSRDMIDETVQELPVR